MKRGGGGVQLCNFSLIYIKLAGVYSVWMLESCARTHASPHPAVKAPSPRPKMATAAATTQRAGGFDFGGSFFIFLTQDNLKDR